MHEIAAVHVEVETIGDDGEIQYDIYPDSMGYAMLLGELVVYDLDGCDVATYSEYGSISSWEVTCNE